MDRGGRRSVGGNFTFTLAMNSNLERRRWGIRGGGGAGQHCPPSRRLPARVRGFCSERLMKFAVEAPRARPRAVGSFCKVKLIL